jgi:hypothetical protein
LVTITNFQINLNASIDQAACESTTTVHDEELQAATLFQGGEVSWDKIIEALLQNAQQMTDNKAWQR